MTRRDQISVVACISITILCLCLMWALPRNLSRINLVNQDSIQPLQRSDGLTLCTAFSINQQDGLWATAKHCVTPSPEGAVTPFTLAGNYAETVYIDPHWEIAVVMSLWTAPVIPLSRAPLTVGETITMWGYPMGLPLLVRTQGTVGTPLMPLVDGGIFSTVFDVTYAPGNSGSPVLRNGEVVSVSWGGMKQSAHALGSPQDVTYRVLAPYTR